MGVHFDRTQVRFREWLEPDAALFDVELPGISYTGRAIVRDARELILRDAAAGEQLVADRLDRLATSLGYAVTCGRLASPLELDGDPREQPRTRRAR